MTLAPTSRCARSWRIATSVSAGWTGDWATPSRTQAYLTTLMVMYGELGMTDWL